MSDNEEHPIEDKDAEDQKLEGIISEGGFHVTNPALMNKLPWIERERLTYAQYKDMCAHEGLPEPTVFEWMETYGLTKTEVEAWEALDEMSWGDFKELDKKYFIIEHLENKTRVCWKRPGKTMGYQSFAEFKNAKSHLGVRMLVRGKPVMQSMAQWWLKSPYTPRFDTAQFLPGVMPWEMADKFGTVYNIWQGWPNRLPRERDLTPPLLGRVIDPDDKWDTEDEPIECALFLEHIRKHMCGGDERVFMWLLGWMADGLLYPGHSEVAIAMTGPSGSGKGTWAKFYGSLFGAHYVPVGKAGDIVGNFNRLLMEACFVFGDEVSFTDSSAEARQLRNLITEDKIVIEFKGIDKSIEDKWFRLAFAANDEWVVRALKDDRRFLCLLVDAGEHNQDRAYFGDLCHEWENGGRVALFRWLTGRWWAERIKSGEWNTQDRPETTLLNNQKNLSLPKIEQAIHQTLLNGEPPCDFVEEEKLGEIFIATELLAAGAKLNLVDHTGLGRLLAMLSGDNATDRSRRESFGYMGMRKRFRGYWLPPLADCRKAWEEHLKRPVDWPDDVVDWALAREVF